MISQGPLNGDGQVIGGDGDGNQDNIHASVLQMERRWNKSKPQGKGIRQGFAFANLGAIECVVGFRIDRYTISMENHQLQQLSSATKCEFILCMHYAQ